MFRTKVVEKVKAYFMFSKFLFKKVMPFMR